MRLLQTLAGFVNTGVEQLSINITSLSTYQPSPIKIKRNTLNHHAYKQLI